MKVLVRFVRRRELTDHRFRAFQAGGWRRVAMAAMLAAVLAMAVTGPAAAARILVPMDDEQTDHLRGYGLAYHVLEREGVSVDWLLNYRGGSFMTEALPGVRKRAIELGVRIEEIDEATVAKIEQLIENNNMEKVLLEKAPKVAVYTPDTNEPWDDAVTMVLEYAKIPYDKFYDREVIEGAISRFDWIHLHHEDFTGQFGKFYSSFRYADWYRAQVTRSQLDAQKFGFAKVAALKLAVARGIKKFVLDGGFLFAMCSAADTLDIALAADGVDIVEAALDGDPADPQAQNRLDYAKTLAFTGFKLIPDPMVYEFSDIDVSNYMGDAGTFQLFEFSAKVDPIPTMLTQCHRNVIEGFFGQTTAFRKTLIKPSVTVMADNNDGISARYIRGDLGKGTFCFYGGHDPADVSHIVGEGPTNLELHKNSPGYRLILNNILFPAAKKKERKT